MSEPAVSLIRRELRKAFPDLKVDADSVAELIGSSVLKRELVGSEKAAEAESRLKKAAQKAQRAARKASAP